MSKLLDALKKQIDNQKAKDEATQTKSTMRFKLDEKGNLQRGASEKKRLRDD
jgi:hypothetical protein